MEIYDRILLFSLMNFTMKPCLSNNLVKPGKMFKARYIRIRDIEVEMHEKIVNWSSTFHHGVCFKYCNSYLECSGH